MRYDYQGVLHAKDLEEGGTRRPTLDVVSRSIRENSLARVIGFFKWSGSCMTAGALISILAIVALPTLASNLDFLHDTPAADFNEEDRRLFAAAMTQALSEADDKETRKWSNPDTKSGGEITPLRTQSRGNTVCRDVSIVNRAKGRTEKSAYMYCREGEGEWRLSFQKPK